MRTKLLGASLLLITVAMVAGDLLVQADEFTKEDLARWQNEYMTVVDRGRELWGSGDLGTNGVACGQCHPNAANTHPETYPKFQQQLGRVVGLRDMINWCLMNPLEREALELDDPDLVALETYATYERKGVELAPGKH
jgi:cytochrome c